ncbi:MAG: T9SS C-terminal target domain-containing protein [Bacteroidota bacterium]
MNRSLLYLAFLTIGFQLTTVSCRAQVPGCTDPLANNHHASATENDGSCTYDPVTVSPESSLLLSEQLSGTSGLICWDGYVWTHNDHEDLNLYGLDTIHGGIGRTLNMDGVENMNWEEITQDEDYIYLGDFGNNNSGNREDLHILRISKASLKAGVALIDTIGFVYEDQWDFSPAEPNLNDFDCEAFLPAGDSLYLFTKQWISGGTCVYALPKIPGNYSAVKIRNFESQGLITGASFLETSKLLVLCGYTSVLQPFLWLMYDFRGTDFFSGNKRKISLSLPFHQVEGIATGNGLNYYISNESFELEPVVSTPQKLHLFNLEELLGDYLSPLGLGESPSGYVLKVYPNPVREVISLQIPDEAIGKVYEIMNSSANILISGVVTGKQLSIPAGNLSPGIYSIRIRDVNGPALPFLKL